MKSITTYLLIISSLTLVVACHSKQEERSSKRHIPSVNDQSLMQQVRAVEKPYVVVNFFATWCKPCIQEMPELIALHNNPQSEASVLLVSIDEKSVYEDGLAAFLDKMGVNFPSYHLSPDSLSNFIRKIDPERDTSIPLNFVYTNTGRLVEVTGMTDQTEISMIIHEDQSFNSL